jgi:hypothetical protein
MLLDAVVVTFVVALLAGGRVSRLKEVDLRGVGLFVLAAAIRVALDVLGAKGSPLAGNIGPWMSIAGYLALLAALLANWRLWPLRLVAVGVFCNFLVIAANGGSMPVDRALAERYSDPRLVRLLDSTNYIVHKPVTPRTRLRLLADVLPLPMFYPRPTFFSPGSVGDIFITVGACAMLIGGLGAFGTGPRRRTKREPGSEGPSA